MQQDPIASVSKGFWDSFWEHIPLFIRRQIMCLKSMILKRKWQNEQTWPALVNGEFRQDSLYLSDIGCLRVVLKIRLIPRVPLHLDRFVVIKEGVISDVHRAIYSIGEGGGKFLN